MVRREDDHDLACKRRDKAAISLGAPAVELVGKVARAALLDGVRLGRCEIAIQTVASVSGIPATAITELMRSPEIKTALDEGNLWLAGVAGAQRPTWDIRNRIGDRAIIQGIWQIEAVISVVCAFLHDEGAYALAGDPFEWSVEVHRR